MGSPPPLKSPAIAMAAFAVLILTAGCQTGPQPRPVPSVPQIGGDLNCAASDHGLEDLQAGWGFCYPNTWKYLERSQSIDSPPGLDLTFDITCVSNCKAACPIPAAGAAPPDCSPQNGLFANMLVSTYERGTSPDLETWITANMPNAATPWDPIAWGNSNQALRLSDGRRVALTPHHVVIMDLHSGLLDLEGEMSSRLGTWKFSF
jgi:hypothetical protein